MADYKLKTTEIEDAQSLIRNLRDSWDETYENFTDYRLMAAGDLPKKMNELLDTNEYYRRSKLKPRIVVDAIRDLTAYISHTIFRNRDGAFSFEPTEEQDINRADKATRLVRYGWSRTNVKMVAKSILRDAAAVGLGYGMVNQWIDRRYTPAGKGIWAKVVGEKPGFKETYRGAKLIRLKTESVFPQKTDDWEKVGAIARVYIVPKSRLQKETVRDGLLEQYKAQIEKIDRIRPDDSSLKYNIYPETFDKEELAKVKDYPVVIGELWQNATYGKDEQPTWYRILIANFDRGGEEEPLIVGFDRDPMQTGFHNIIPAQIFPVEDRLHGMAVPEMLRALNLEMFHKRNQSIDYLNLFFNLSGTIWGKTNGLPPEDILVQTGKYKGYRGNSPKDLFAVKLDSSPLIAGAAEMSRIDQDVQHTMAQNQITSGRDPQRREAATIGALIDENAKIRQTDPVEEVEETLIKPVAMSYLMQAQVFMTKEQRFRVLGSKGMIDWETVTPDDIQGHFDVKCVSSSQIMPRSMKQANINAIIQTFANNLYIAPKLDWVSLYKDVVTEFEWEKAAAYIKDPSIVQEEIAREEDFMVANPDMPWVVNKGDDDSAHLDSHMQNIAHLPNGKMHIQEHIQSLQMKQGQMGGGNDTAAYSNQGELLNDISAGSSTKALGR